MQGSQQAIRSFQESEAKMGALQRDTSRSSLISNAVKNDVWQLYKFVSNALLEPDGTIARLVAEGLGMEALFDNDYNQWVGVWVNSLKRTVREKLGEKRGNCSQNIRKACHGKRMWVEGYGIEAAV